MKHYGIWIPAGLDSDGTIASGGWMRFVSGELFRTTSVAVARAQREVSDVGAGLKGKIREFDQLGGPGDVVEDGTVTVETEEV